MIKKICIIVGAYTMIDYVIGSVKRFKRVKKESILTRVEKMLKDDMKEGDTVKIKVIDDDDTSEVDKIYLKVNGEVKHVMN